ncbi:hypothetical protein Aduo_019030 [Ancylostoma duodenale]
MVLLYAAKFDSIHWLKDGEQLTEILEKAESKDIVINGPTLTIIGGKQQTEGDYQCVAAVSEVRLSNRQVIKTTLVSDPIKLRRARITKFDQTTNHYVHVEQGQVARLPCAGLPDVVPGPAEICFIKSNSDFEGCLSDKVDSNYLSTATGMQIAVVQPHHEGEYYCVVRNEYTKQTRKSPRYVKLRVDKASNGSHSGQPDPPQLVFPSKENRPDSPIVVDAVTGQDIILECVFVRAKIFWTKAGETSPQISLTDDEARLRQIWGNLRIRQVSQDDSGIYSCHGLSPSVETFSLNEDHPQVYYLLVVHAPTDVHLEMHQNMRDKSWQLSCFAKNVRYEIPMVYVNGTPLTDAISEMGVASSTNFYSNPVNATIRIRSNYSGSVQCISRPAMDEAEVYGIGLERGRSHNMYIVNSPSRDHLIKQGPVNVTATVGDDVELICLVIQRVSSKYWLKDGSYVPFGAARTQRVGSNSLKIHKVEKKDEGWYTCVVVGEGSEKSEQQAYLRVTARTAAPPFPASGDSHVIRKKDDVVSMEDVRGFVTGSHVRIQWSVIGKMEALTSVVGFKIEARSAANDSWVVVDNVGSHVRATTIKDLAPNSRYQFRVVVVKDDLSVVVSNVTSWMYVGSPVIERAPADTEIDGENKTGAFGGEFRRSDTVSTINHLGNATSDDEMLQNVTMEKNIPTFTYKVFTEALSTKVLAMLFSALLCLSLLICCVICYRIHQSNRSPYIFKSTNGKFLDTSYRIFNEQKVHKSRVDHFDAGSFETEHTEECSPMRVSSRMSSAQSFKKFRFTGDHPSLCGIEASLSEEDYQ